MKCQMIDWFRGEILFHHVPIPSGQIMSIEADGEIAWVAPKRLDVRSSHETALFLKSSGSAGDGFASHLMIDGNLAKFLQGHNVFGSCDLNTLLALSFQKIYELFEDHFYGWAHSLPFVLGQIRKGNYKVTMLDINQMYDVGNDFSVEAWLHAAEMRAVSRHGRAVRDKGTIYLGKESRRWAFKFYNKWREMNAKSKRNTHQLPDYLKGLGIEEFVQGQLRAELRIFGKELEERHGITYGHQLNPTIINQLFNQYLGKITMTTQVTIIDEQLLKMPRSVQATYQLWRQGANLRGLMRANTCNTPSPTFYRHRKILLEYGVDIAHMCLSPEQNNVVPMMRIIEAVPVAIPAWAYERGLIAA